jgi:hypothetical protein
VAEVIYTEGQIKISAVLLTHNFPREKITPVQMDSIAELLTSYADLNGSHIMVLKSEPSPLEFMRFVALNTPFVVKNAASEWKATKFWSSSYFRQAMTGQTINVAVTPYGSDL